MFVGRDRELELLEEAYGSETFECVVVYGRRRVGKTSLINQFLRNKEYSYFFTAQQTLAKENLEGLSASLAPLIKPYPNTKLYPGPNLYPDLTPSPVYPVYRSFEEALTAIFERSLQEHCVFVIDEYPYLAECYRGISSLLQTFIDRYKNKSKMLLILCGSSMSFMEHQVLGEKSPLYGRRTRQIKLEPFDAFDAAKMLGNAAPEQIVELYSLVGGVPLYLEQLNPSKTTEWNIANRVFRKGSFLEAEPQNFLSQEVRKPATYSAVISAIANGAVRAKEIADQVGAEQAAVHPILRTLEDLHIVTQKAPVASNKKRQTRYGIVDNLFAFWYSFVPRYATSLDADMANAVTSTIMQREFPTYIGPVFEEICRQWLIREIQLGHIEMLPKEMGAWWGTNPVSRQQEEIDIVAEGSNGEMLFGECKWRKTPIDSDVLDLLVERSSLFIAKRKMFYLFSKSGFTERCIAAATSGMDVRLVSVEEMFG